MIQSDVDNQQHLGYPELVEFVGAILRAVGVPEQVSQLEAEITAEVDLAGVQSHGVQLLPGLIQHIREGRVNPNPVFRKVAERPASVLYEVEQGIGRYSSAKAMDQAVERARTFGIGCVAVRGIAHWGRGHSYALRAAREGCIGLAFTNATCNFPAWGTRTASLGNNPMAIGIPAEEGMEPIVLDIAMTQAAIRKIMDAATLGETVPVGWGVDEEGRPTTDPRAILTSQRFLPMGGHKGSGLAFMIELLTAGLAGGLLCFEQGREGKPNDFEGGSSKLFIALEPFGPWLAEKARDLKEYLKSVPPAPEQGDVQWPGEQSYRRKYTNLKRGIPFRPPLVALLEKLSQEFQVPLRWL